MNKKLFGTSGIRGVVNRDLTPVVYNGICRASGTEPAIRVLAESRAQTYTRDMLACCGMTSVNDLIKEAGG